MAALAVAAGLGLSLGSAGCLGNLAVRKGDEALAEGRRDQARGRYRQALRQGIRSKSERDRVEAALAEIDRDVTKERERSAYASLRARLGEAGARVAAGESDDAVLTHVVDTYDHRGYDDGDLERQALDILRHAARSRLDSAREALDGGQRDRALGALDSLDGLLAYDAVRSRLQEPIEGFLVQVLQGLDGDVEGGRLAEAAAGLTRVRATRLWAWRAVNEPLEPAFEAVAHRVLERASAGGDGAFEALVEARRAGGWGRSDWDERARRGLEARFTEELPALTERLGARDLDGAAEERTRLTKRYPLTAAMRDAVQAVDLAAARALAKGKQWAELRALRAKVVRAYPLSSAGRGALLQVELEASAKAAAGKGKKKRMEEVRAFRRGIAADYPHDARTVAGLFAVDLPIARRLAKKGKYPQLAALRREIGESYTLTDAMKDQLFDLELEPLEALAAAGDKAGLAKMRDELSASFRPLTATMAGRLFDLEYPELARLAEARDYDALLALRRDVLAAYTPTPASATRLKRLFGGIADRYRSRARGAPAGARFVLLKVAALFDGRTAGIEDALKATVVRRDTATSEIGTVVSINASGCPDWVRKGLRGAITDDGRGQDGTVQSTLDFRCDIRKRRIDTEPRTRTQQVTDWVDEQQSTTTQTSKCIGYSSGIQRRCTSWATVPVTRTKTVSVPVSRNVSTTYYEQNAQYDASVEWTVTIRWKGRVEHREQGRDSKRLSRKVRAWGTSLPPFEAYEGGRWVKTRERPVEEQILALEDSLVNPMGTAAIQTLARLANALETREEERLRRERQAAIDRRYQAQVDAMKRDLASGDALRVIDAHVRRLGMGGYQPSAATRAVVEKETLFAYDRFGTRTTRIPSVADIVGGPAARRAAADRRRGTSRKGKGADPSSKLHPDATQVKALSLHGYEEKARSSPSRTVVLDRFAPDKPRTTYGSSGEWLSIGRPYSMDHGLASKAGGKRVAVTALVTARGVPIAEAPIDSALGAALHLDQVNLTGRFSLPVGVTDVRGWELMALYSLDAGGYSNDPPAILWSLGLRYADHARRRDRLAGELQDDDFAYPVRPDAAMRSLDVPIFATVPTTTWLSVDLELHPNLLQLGGDDPEVQHLSPASLGLTAYWGTRIYLHGAATAYVGAEPERMVGWTFELGGRL